MVGRIQFERFVEQKYYWSKTMKHLYFIVEGETELEFVNRLLIPYLVEKGLHTNIQGILITMGGGGHGFNNIEHFKNTIKPVLRYGNEPFITTLIDYYGINSDKKMPNYAECTRKMNVDERISCLESELNRQVQSIKPYKFFIPYIQKHEMETLLFANPIEGFSLEDENIQKAVIKACSQFENIEDINHTPQGAPSKRLESIYKASKKKYEKGVDAIDIAEFTGVENMLEKCPRFKNWVNQLIISILSS
jgi:hypothetical protein